MKPLDQSAHSRGDGLHPVLTVGLWDIGLPLAIYYGCRLAGVTEPAALAAAASAALLRVAWSAGREHRFDWIAGLTCLVLATGLGLSYVTGDDRLVLASKSVTTLAIAAGLFASLAAGRPAAFGVAVRFGPADDRERAHWDRLYRTVPRFRRVYVVMTAVWAGVLLGESILRIPLIYLLPADAAVPASYALLGAAIAGNVGWAAWYGQRGEQRAVHEQPAH